MLKYKSKLHPHRCNPHINEGCSDVYQPSQSIKLLSFNIQVGNNTAHFHHYFTRGWQHLLPYKGRLHKLTQIAQILAPYDIVALQETDGGSLRSNGINQVELLAKLANFPYWHQQLNRNLGKLAQHSNGMLSRLKPSHIENHPLPGMKGRGAIFVYYGSGETTLVIVMMHLALSKHTRTQQLNYIYNLIAPYPYKILMGDMNAEDSELIDNSLFKESGLVLPKQKATYPSWAPSRYFDHILLSQELKINHLAVLDEPISDHLPIEIELALPTDLLQTMTQPQE